MGKDNGVMLRVREPVRASLWRLAARYRDVYQTQGWRQPWWQGDDGPTMGELIERLIALDLARLLRGKRPKTGRTRRIPWSPDDLVVTVDGVPFHVESQNRKAGDV